MMKKDNTTTAELVIVPVAGKGHLTSTIEFAKRLLDHAPTAHDHHLHHKQQLSITILVMPPFSAPSSLSTAAGSDDDDGDGRIKYVHLPPVDSPSMKTELLHSAPEKFFSLHIENYKSHVKEAIKNDIVSSYDNSVQLVGLVVDMFCTSMIDVAHELDIPSYVFFTSSAGFLGFLSYLPTRYDDVGVHFRESEEEDNESCIPSYVNPVPVSSLPSFALNKDGYETFMTHAKRFKKAKGIIVNTFDELESHAVRSVQATYGEDETPPVYTVGPLLNLTSLTKKSKAVDDQANKIMKWLDDQPPSSVVLLCFGSMGSFEEPSQLKEIALGLERSGHRFLWSIRQAPPDKYVTPSDCTNYEEILPLGFLERIGERGMVCGWIPQVEVLAHRATGGFVSHCGWNSILESLWFGVPIAAWPMYAEQQINAHQMVRDLGLAVEVKLGYRKSGSDLVMADKIERAVTCLMDGDSEVRKRVKEMGEKSRKAVTDGGSSFVSFDRLMKNMLGEHVMKSNLVPINIFFPQRQRKK